LPHNYLAFSVYTLLITIDGDSVLVDVWRALVEQRDSLLKMLYPRAVLYQSPKRSYLV